MTGNDIPKLLRINGIDVSVPTSISYTYSQLDGEATTRDVAGTMHRDRIAQKITLSISWDGLQTANSVREILNAIDPPSFKVIYYHPKFGWRSDEFYAGGDAKADVYTFSNDKNNPIFKSLKIDLIQV